MNTDKGKNSKEQDNLPGYPYYPAGEDITQPGNNNGRETFESQSPLNPDIEKGNIPTGNEADITAEERQILESDGGYSKLDSTDADGDRLNESVDNIGADLDVPGSEADDANEEIGEEDEENNYYSRNDENDTGTAGIP